MAPHRPSLVTVVRRVSATLFYGFFALAGDFYPMDHELSMRPRIRKLFWHLTLLWAVLGIARASMTLWLLQTQTLDTFVLVKSISMLSLNLLATCATIGLAVLVARKEGLMGHPDLVPVRA